MLAIVCQSDAENTAEAVLQLMASATEQLGDAAPRAGLLFASPAFDHAMLLDACHTRWPGLALIGGTTDGEFSSVGGLHQDSAVLVLLAGEGFDAHVGAGIGLADDLAGAVATATADLPADASVWFTVCAPSADAAAVVRELERQRDRRRGGDASAAWPIVGGLSGDHAEFAQMREFCGPAANRDSVAVLALTGDVRVGVGIGAGWFPLGRSFCVTAASGPVVTGIADRPAIDVFHEHWGSVPTAESLAAYPFAVYPDGLDGPYYLRAVLGADRDTGALRFAGGVPEGALIRMTEVLPEGVLAGTAAAVRDAAEAFDGVAPKLALIVSCAARRWVLGTGAASEYECIGRALRSAGVEPAIAGYYAYGEMAPALPPAADPVTPAGGVSNCVHRTSTFHNESLVALLIGQ
ncbi:MAG: FIST C-terminal domain-containing protein [bacterium]|nr:FIST C-terminal domain-containing protein [bacterium]